MPDLADPNPCPAVRGRLAPSPTGYLHLGNAWSFLLAWLACRSAGGTLVLRMEDLDPERSRPAFAAAIMEDLRWLGLDWDEGPDKEKARSMESYFQSARHAFYQGALRRLEDPEPFSAYPHTKVPAYPRYNKPAPRSIIYSLCSTFFIYFKYS